MAAYLLSAGCMIEICAGVGVVESSDVFGESVGHLYFMVLLDRSLFVVVVLDRFSIEDVFTLHPRQAERANVSPASGDRGRVGCSNTR